MKFNTDRMVKIVQAKLKKHGPTIKFGLGILAFGGTVVTACMATRQLDDTLDEVKADIDKVKESKEITEVNDGIATKVVNPDYQKNLTKAYLRGGLKIGKLYSKSAVLGAASLTCLFSSRHDLIMDNKEITGLYLAEKAMRMNLSKNVKEQLGEEAEYRFRNDIHEKKIEDTTVDLSTGETKTEEKDVPAYVDGLDCSRYARFFDEGSSEWEKDPEYNLSFLRNMQAYANDKLVSDGFLFLNDVYKMLGIPVSRIGQRVGWLYDKDNPLGDNYVDFGIYDVTRPKNRDFVNGYEDVILLDFNVDGEIWDKI